MERALEKELNEKQCHWVSWIQNFFVYWKDETTSTKMKEVVKKKEIFKLFHWRASKYTATIELFSFTPLNLDTVYFV